METAERIAESMLIVLRKHPAAQLLSYGESPLFGIRAGNVILTGGWLTPRGAWSAMAEQLRPGVVIPLRPCDQAEHDCDPVAGKVML